MTRTEFIKKIAIYATADFKSTGVPASLTIAQAALESAWGASGLTIQANNLFGIKGKGAAGSCTMPTTEYVNGNPIRVEATFRAYNNWGESITDHSKLMLDGVSWNRYLYAKVLNKDGKTAAKEVAAAGYATDPKYADKLIAIMDAHHLYQYDVKGSPSGPASNKESEVEDMAKVAELEKSIEIQKERIVALEKRLNISGKETYASHYAEAVIAAKATGAIATSADKSKIELNMIQMIHNLGLFKKGGG